MFQYAAGRAISLEQNVPLRLDVSGFASYRLHHGFELARIFDCAIDIATEKDIQDVVGHRAGGVLRKILVRPCGAVFRGHRFIVEPYFHYWPGIKKVPQECYLVGYWQSERYFRDIAPAIRSDFVFKMPPEGLNAELAEWIAQVNAVSLHVRRGDYVSNPVTNATHGVCSLDYYRDAVRYVSDRVEKPHFFIFSDDAAWAKEHLKVDFPHQYLDYNHGAESYNDMRLMSMCRHHIIANSSFSWWGAWLNPDMNKIVVAPKKWFADDRNTEDLFPQGWVTL